MGKYITQVVKVLIEGGKKQKAVYQLQFFVKPTRYTGEMLRKLRAERGVGNVRKIKHGVEANG